MNLTATIRRKLASSFALDVAFSAQPGITMLFGASGAGKTTVLRCLAGLDRPDEGRIAIGDQLLFDSTTGRDVPVEHRNIGYVLQQLALFPHLTIGDNLEYGLHALSPADRRARVGDISERFRISHLRARRPGAISGGERQRVALARSLVMNPAALLLDEPLSALDHATQSRIIEDLRTWNASHGIPILYVTHAHREVFALGERVLVVDGGRLVADGPPLEVMGSPAHEPLAQLAGFENFFDGVVTACRPDAGTMSCRLREVEIEAPWSSAAPGSLVRVAIRAGDILLANEEPRGLSARNILRGSIHSLRREGPTMVAEVDAGERFVVHITPDACHALGLANGVRVWLIIKTHSFRIVAS